MYFPCTDIIALGGFGHTRAMQLSNILLNLKRRKPVVPVLLHARIPDNLVRLGTASNAFFERWKGQSLCLRQSIVYLFAAEGRELSSKCSRLPVPFRLTAAPHIYFGCFCLFSITI
jgi:hypothetical protein